MKLCRKSFEKNWNKKYIIQYLRILTQTLFFFLKNPLIIVFYAMAASFTAPSIHGIVVMIGLPYEFLVSGRDYIVFGRWLLITGIPILVNGFILTQGTHVDTFIKIRLKEKKEFCKILALTCIAINTIWCIFLMLILVYEQGAQIALKSFFLLQSNIILWESIQISLFYWKPLCISEEASGWVTILLNAIICIIGIRVPSLYKFLPSFWGMLCRGNTENNIFQYCVMLALNTMISTMLIVLLHERE